MSKSRKIQSQPEPASTGPQLPAKVRSHRTQQAKQTPRRTLLFRRRLRFTLRLQRTLCMIRITRTRSSPQLYSLSPRKKLLVRQRPRLGGEDELLDGGSQTSSDPVNPDGGLGPLVPPNALGWFTHHFCCRRSVQSYVCRLTRCDKVQ